MENSEESLHFAGYWELIALKGIARRACNVSGKLETARSLRLPLTRGTFLFSLTWMYLCWVMSAMEFALNH